MDGDMLALRSLTCLALLATGWRYGDSDPSDDDGPGGGEVVWLDAFRKIAKAA
jgi:hypothetical protein